jgi:sulfite reductase (ferredoxin)
MYKLPTILKTEIEAFSQQISDFKNGVIEAVKFKAIRVPMGIYEQRINGNFMVRVRCAAGMISPKQLQGIAAIAIKNGIEDIHFTTRQELQLHGIKLEQTPAILEGLFELGLSSRGGGGNTVRNIMASEDAGISTTEYFDVTPYALALTNTLIAETDSWSLPRKYKIAFASDENDNANALFNDLGFVATLKEQEKGFKVFLGGGLGAKSSVGHLLFDFLPATDILYVAEAVKQLFSEHGNRRNRHKARIRFLFLKLGKEKVFELFYNYYNQLKSEGKYDLVLPELPIYLHSGSPLVEIPNNIAYLKWVRRYVKEQNQQGFYTVEIPFEHGMTNAQTLADLANYLLPFGDDSLRLNMRQNIRLRNIPGNDLPDLFKLLKSKNIEIERSRIQNNLVACTGADTCRLGICLAKGASTAIKKELNQLGEDSLDRLENIMINLSGCPNSCGQHAIAPLGFYGKASRNDRLYPAYYVTVGGQSGVSKAQLGEVVGEISARDLPKFTYEVLQQYAQQNENEYDFYSFLTADDRANVKQILQKYTAIPSFDDDKNYYFDWGAQEIFSLKGKGAAECSAGMFDMIDFDRDQILMIRTQLEKCQNERETQSLLYQTVFHSSRMLLVTRGIEPKSREEIFATFNEVFIQEGYVDKQFAPLVKLAEQNSTADFSAYESLVHQLADSVIALYEGMDDSLQFKLNPIVLKTTDKDPEVQKKANEEISFKDFRGVACPMNFVKTKIELAQMQQGELLRILLDDGAPINNVSGSVRNEGHEVLEVNKIDKYWSVLIRKN